MSIRFTCNQIALQYTSWGKYFLVLDKSKTEGKT